MTVTLEKIERELNVPKEQLLREGISRYLEFELRSVHAEISKIHSKHGIQSFDELWTKLKRGEIAEFQCFDDLPRLEYLELRAEKVQKLLEEHLHT